MSMQTGNELADTDTHVLATRQSKSVFFQNTHHGIKFEAQRATFPGGN